MKKNKFRKVLVACILFVCGFLNTYLSGIVSATGRAIVMAPMSQKIILSPGETYKGGFIVSNPLDADGNLSYIVEVSSFYPTSVDANDNDDYGGANYTSKSDLNQMVDWIKVENPIGLASPGEEITIIFSIDVPEDAPAGGQYAALLVRENPEYRSEDGAVAVNEIMQMAHIIYGDVAGETREEGVIMDNNIPSIVLNDTLVATSMVRNDGNVHTDAEYILQVWPITSDEEICTNEEEASTSLIMPETKRFHAEECTLPTIGIFRAKQTVKIFGEISIVEKIIIVCPVWLMFIIIFAIAALIIWLVLRAKSRSKRRAED